MREFNSLMKIVMCVYYMYIFNLLYNMIVFVYSFSVYVVQRMCVDFVINNKLLYLMGSGFQFVKCVIMN